MTMPPVKIKRLYPNVKMPRRMSDGAAGFDLFAYLPWVSASLYPRGRLVVPCGICIEIPPGYEGQIRSRSGLAAQEGITVLNAPGTIDSDYRGEVKVILINHGAYPYTIVQGSRIAQIVFGPVEIPDLVEVGQLSETKRGTGGCGSTGV